MLVAFELSAACRGEADQAKRSDVARMAEAVRKLREAPNHGRAPLLQALKHTECSAGDACALKQACTEAYALQEHALAGISAVHRETVGGAPAEPVPSAAAALLTEVTADLEKAKELAQSCADLEGSMRRKYSL